jgi:hypothetical protein
LDHSGHQKYEICTSAIHSILENWYKELEYKAVLTLKKSGILPKHHVIPVEQKMAFHASITLNTGKRV